MTPPAPPIAIPAEARPLTLDDARDAIGCGVVYTPRHGAPVEGGVITGVSSLYVFVQYDGQRGSMATPPELLTFEVQS